MSPVEQDHQKHLLMLVGQNSNPANAPIPIAKASEMPVRSYFPLQFSVQFNFAPHGIWKIVRVIGYNISGKSVLFTFY